MKGNTEPTTIHYQHEVASILNEVLNDAFQIDYTEKPCDPGNPDRELATPKLRLGWEHDAVATCTFNTENIETVRLAIRKANELGVPIEIVDADSENESMKASRVREDGVTATVKINTDLQEAIISHQEMKRLKIEMPEGSFKE